LRCTQKYGTGHTEGMIFPVLQFCSAHLEPPGTLPRTVTDNDLLGTIKSRLKTIDISVFL